MAYTNSPLVSYTKLSPNHSGQRTHSIDRITPHCVVGQCSVETLGNIMYPTSRQASCNYGKVNELMGAKTTVSSKSIDELAREVIQGKWGNGEERKNRLISAGYDYSAVQAKVNELMGGIKSTKSVDQLAREVIYGYWGNGKDRKNRLTAAGYDYSAVQNRVNELLN